MKLLSLLLGVFTSVQAHALEFEIGKITNKAGHTLNIVRMKGVIDNREARRWIGEIAALDPQLDTLFVLNSPGGNVPIGLFTIKKIEQFISEQALNKRATWIVIEGQCSSMCVPMFFTWPNRFAVIDTRIGLHGVSDGGLGSDAELTQAYLENMRERARARGETAMLSWIARMVSSGQFSTFQLAPYPIQEIAREQGLLSSEKIVGSVEQLIEKL